MARAFVVAVGRPLGYNFCRRKAMGDSAALLLRRSVTFLLIKPNRNVDLLLPSSIRARLLFHVGLVLTMAMLLLDVVAAGVQYRTILRDRIDTAEFFCESARVVIAADMEMGETRVAMQRLAAAAGAEAVAFVVDGRVVFSQQATSGMDLVAMAMAVEKKGVPRPEVSGRMWWVFFPGARSVRYAVPLAEGGGAVAVSFSLWPGLSGVMAGQRLLLVYLIANLFLFLFISNLRVERLLFRPLRRLVARAEDIGLEEEFFPAPGQKNSEFNRLSRSLNVMLRRLNAEREELARTVTSLEEANSSLRRAQKEVIQAEKLAAVGRLSAGIAHEIGNPVGIISGYLDLLRQDNLSPETRDDFISRAHDETERINRIVRQLLDFSRNKGDEEGVFAVNDVIARTMEICASQPLTSKIRLISEPAATFDNVYGNPDLLEQVLLNLVINSVDAIRGSGIADEEGMVELTSFNSDGKVIINVSDNGPGISDADLDKLFDPFFTTKEPGSGTGLGLFIAYSVVESMNGRISVANIDGGGARFSIELPLHSQETGDGKADDER